MDTLSREDHGSFVLGTASGSSYRLDIDETCVTMRRVPATEPTAEVGGVSHLRRDGETVTVLSFLPLNIGSRGVFALSPLSDNGASATMRRTTEIVSIVSIGKTSQQIWRDALISSGTAPEPFVRSATGADTQVDSSDD